MSKNNIVEIHPAPEGLEEAARLAKELAIKRQRIKGIRAQIDKAEIDLRKLKTYQAIEVLKDSVTTLQAESFDIESELRKTALDVGVELKMKNPAPGITITKKTTFTIDEPDTALEACRESFPQLIEEKIKTAELKKIVVALGKSIEGTTLNIEEFGQVKIAGNLEELYLEDGNDVPF